MPAVERRGSPRRAGIPHATARGSEQGFVQRRSGDCLRTGGGCVLPRLREAAVQQDGRGVPRGHQHIPTQGSGGFGEGWLWSSSQNNNNNAWKQRFSDGDQNNNNKNNKYAVRACRALGWSRPRRRDRFVGAGGIFCRHD